MLTFLVQWTHSRTVVAVTGRLVGRRLVTVVRGLVHDGCWPLIVGQVSIILLLLRDHNWFDFEWQFGHLAEDTHELGGRTIGTFQFATPRLVVQQIGAEHSNILARMEKACNELGGQCIGYLKNRFVGQCLVHADEVSLVGQAEHVAEHTLDVGQTTGTTSAYEIDVGVEAGNDFLLLHCTAQRVTQILCQSKH